MAGAAAGGFVIRAFQSMLKECSNKKYSALQTAIKTYLDTVKELNQQTQVEESKQTSPAASDQSVSSGSHVGSDRVRPRSDDSIGGPDAELVLKPLRFAFETKHMKIMELALDCLHKLIEYNHLEGDPGLDDGKNAQLLMEILNMVCSSVDNSSPDSTTLQVLKVLLTAVASTKMRVHGEPLLEIIRVCYIIALNSKSPISQATSKAMLVQMLSIIFGRMEADVISTSSEIKEDLEVGSESKSMFLDILSVDQSNDPSFASEEIRGSTDIKELEAVLTKGVEREEVGDMIREMDTESATVNQRDALLVFRTLCKMGMKEDNNETTVKTRVLSLELLQGVLEGVGNSFMKSFYTVKAHLSFVVLRASVSQSPAILQYAAGIFSVILRRFRVTLKAELGMLFPIIFLRPLDGSDLNQKLSVLRMLEKVFKDPQTLIDLYLNYDCDLEAPNLFEKMVVTLSKIYQGTPDADPKSFTALQTGSVKLSSLQGLVDVLKSLVNWEKFHTGLKLHNKNTESSELENLPGDIYESRSEEDSSISSDKSTAEVVVSKFNQHPEKGIQHLISSQLVENTPASVAQFLLNTSNLDKTMIGYYMGQREELPRSVMHAYVESMDFSGMRFDAAIREFLKGFRLPRDAQKVDCILEKFAERYCADNPALFKHADTAYVLAYAAMMLSTDAHNPTVQPRLGKGDFIRIVTMNNFAETTPQELLEEIYDSISKEAIVVEDDHVKIFENIKQRRDVEKSGLIDFLNLSFPKSNSSSDSKSEKEPIVKKIQALIKDQGGRKAGVFYTSHKVEILYPMVEAVGWPLLATFSVTMGELEHKPRISLCMEGFKEGIHITHVLGMDTMRYAFLTSLLRYNYLHAPKDMREKNTEALRALLDLCDADVYALQHSWFAILECISRLEYAVSSPAMIATIMQGSNQISRDVVLQALRELSGKPTEQVFMNTIKLPSESVVEFFSALCSVSAEELKQTPARLFSLQKVVEISYYNMTRIHMVWARIWSIVSQHLIVAGSHPDEKVAKYAVESLGQLGQKYLDRAELANFTFQNYIVKPFAVLMRNSLSSSMQMLLAECIVQIIKSKAGNIKSGWRSIFMVFSAAAEDDVESIVESAFENVEQVILEHFNLIVGDCFMDCVHCLIGFASNRSSPSVSLKAIALLRICENRLSESIISLAAQNSIDDKLDKTCDFAEQYWFPMLDGLSNLISDPRPEVRNCALEVLFDLLNERGNKFPSQFWEKIFHQVLFPIFDHLRHAGKESAVSSGDEWLRESSIHSLQLSCNLFNTFYKDVCFMLPQLLSLLLDCAKKTDQSVVSLSLGALTHLIEIGGHQFIDHDWDTLLKSIREASFSTQPLELLNDLGFENRKQRKVLALDSGSSSPMAGNKNHHIFPENGNTADHNHERSHTGNMEGSEDLTSPSGRAVRLSNDGGLQHSQSFGQKIMGNMNFFSRSFSSKPKNVTSDAMVPSSPSKLPGPITELSISDDEESPMMESIRSKCMTQLLLLGAIDIIQKKYWNNLNAQQKVTMMEILFSVLEFAASYNSYSNLRLRMLQSSTERPPLNLLRQELFATCIYLNILQKTTAGSVLEDELTKEDKLERIAEEKLVNFCEHTLKEASDFQSTIEEATDMNIHRVLELRSPLIVQMLKSMCQMNPKIFKIHLRKFYPSMTKLINCEQMDIRGALADLLGMQLKILVTDETS